MDGRRDEYLPASRRGASHHRQFTTVLEAASGSICSLRSLGRRTTDACSDLWLRRKARRSAAAGKGGKSSYPRVRSPHDGSRIGKSCQIEPETRLTRGLLRGLVTEAAGRRGHAQSLKLAEDDCQWMRIFLKRPFSDLRSGALTKPRLSVAHFMRSPLSRLANKGGVVSMARAIAADFAPRNIRVNIVSPGATKTPIWRRGPRASLSAEQSAEVGDLFSSTVPLGRWGEAEEVAKAVLFLATDDSSYINAVPAVRPVRKAGEERNVLLHASFGSQQFRRSPGGHDGSIGPR